MAKKKQEASDAKPKIFKKYRGGIELTKAEIKYIKAERKKLRKELKKRGLKNKRDFEVTASSQGLYFDDKKRFGFLWWLLHGRGLWALFGSMATLLTVLYLFSLIPQMKGHFTINMSADMFKNGFVLSETEDFSAPSIQLFSDPVENAPCISFSSISEDADLHEGSHGESNYFGYTFFLRNEGEETVDYHYELEINSESKNLSKACWVMIFEDGKMTFYANPREDGTTETIPGRGIDDRGYPNPSLMSQSANLNQFELLGTRGNRNYYRIIPENFESESLIEEKMRYDIAPMEVHKYTVIIWLEGDDPECTNELIDGHLGLEFNFQLIDEYEAGTSTNIWNQVKYSLEDLADNLRFWE